MLALLEVTPAEIASLGCAEIELVGDALGKVRSIVEKPKPEEAPSNLAVIGRYVFSPDVFDAIDRIVPGVGGELQLTDAIGLLLERAARCVRPDLHRRPLRHRQEDGVPASEHRARARATRRRRPNWSSTSATWCAPAASHDRARRRAGRDHGHRRCAPCRRVPCATRPWASCSRSTSCPASRFRRSPTPRWTATRCGPLTPPGPPMSPRCGSGSSVSCRPGARRRSKWATAKRFAS